MADAVAEALGAVFDAYVKASVADERIYWKYTGPSWSARSIPKACRSRGGPRAGLLDELTCPAMR